MLLYIWKYWKYLEVHGSTEHIKNSFHIPLSSGCFPRVQLFTGSIREERAEQVVPMEEYPTPVRKFHVKNLSTKFFGRQIGSVFPLQENLIRFSIFGWYLLVVCGCQLFVRISTDSSNIFELISFCLIFCMYGGLTCSILGNFFSVLDEVIVSFWKVRELDYQ